MRVTARQYEGGLRCIYVPVKTQTASVLVNVRSGSNSERRGEHGIAHFIEHMLFEGTKKMPSSFLVANEIEKLGGELNAATSNERTYFYAKVPARHFGSALNVLSDIVCSPLFDPAAIEKEKSVVLDEIRLVNDQPRFYQWVLFSESLFGTHPAGRPIYGAVSDIARLDRNHVLDYYCRHYGRKNITVAVAGNVPGCFSLVKRAFSSLAGGFAHRPGATVRLQKKSRCVTERKGTAQGYAVLGYRTVPRQHPDSVVLDVIRAILGRGQSGKIFDEIRNKRGLAYEVGVHHNPSTDFGFFAVYFSAEKKNLARCRSIALAEIGRLSEAGRKELSEAKAYLEGEFLLQCEDTCKAAELAAFWDQAGLSIAGYPASVRKVSVQDVRRAAQKYLKFYTMTKII